MDVKRVVAVGCLLLLFTWMGVSQTDCSAYNSKTGPVNYGSHDFTEHWSGSGSHQFAHTSTGACTLTGTASYYYSVPCSVQSTSNSYSGRGENGITIPWYHTTSQADKQGYAYAGAGGSATSDSQGVVAVHGCLLLPCGSIGISITGPGTGAGFSIANSSKPLWEDGIHAVTSCPARTLPRKVPCSSPTYSAPSTQGYIPYNSYCAWVWSTTQCQWVWQCWSSPLIVDTTGHKIQMTDPETAYVTFDLWGDGKPERWSWTKPGSGNAWLVLDLDGNGVIDSGKELFTSFGPHSDGGTGDKKNANGFNDLAFYDLPEQGGNMDAILDNRDAIWGKLRLWIDNHCYKTPDIPCTSLPEELFKLDDPRLSKHIDSFSLVYDMDIPQNELTDKWGNQFKFKAVLNPLKHTQDRDAHGNGCCDLQKQSNDPRMVWDVTLQKSTR